MTATATLVATELVANVVRHAHTTMDFTLGLRDDRDRAKPGWDEFVRQTERVRPQTGR